MPMRVETNVVDHAAIVEAVYFGGDGGSVKAESGRTFDANVDK